jgi:hypothetical protein
VIVGDRFAKRESQIGSRSRDRGTVAGESGAARAVPAVCR